MNDMTHTSKNLPLLVVVSGPWSSGTSAVAGMLDALGLFGLPPHARTVDERTPNCFESLEFRRLVLTLADEDALKLIVPFEQCVQTLRSWAEQHLLPQAGQPGFQGCYVKFPLAAILLPAMIEAWKGLFQLRHVYVLRALRDIEATRARRNWKPVLGLQGARVLYSQLFAVLLNRTEPTHIIRFHELLAEPEAQLQQLIDFLALQPGMAARRAALEFLRPARPDGATS